MPSELKLDSWLWEKRVKKSHMKKSLPTASESRGRWGMPLGRGETVIPVHGGLHAVYCTSRELAVTAIRVGCLPRWGRGGVLLQENLNLR